MCKTDLQFMSNMCSVKCLQRKTARSSVSFSITCSMYRTHLLLLEFISTTELYFKLYIKLLKNSTTRNHKVYLVTIDLEMNNSTYTQT